MLEGFNRFQSMRLSWRICKKTLENLYFFQKTLEMLYFFMMTFALFSLCLWFRPIFRSLPRGSLQIQGSWQANNPKYRRKMTNLPSFSCASAVIDWNTGKKFTVPTPIVMLYPKCHGYVFGVYTGYHFHHAKTYAHDLQHIKYWFYAINPLL